MQRMGPSVCRLLVLSWAAVGFADDAFDDLIYVLQPESLTIPQLAAAEFHWMVLEPSRDGSTSGEISAAEVSAIRGTGPCEKNILAYLSIGEAESYRDYFDAAWVDGNGDPIPGVAPAWLGPTNPDWEGNYKVRYWDPDWQALIYGAPSGPDETPLDRIIDAGYDGVYLDIVDGYYFWSDPNAGIPELTRMQARGLMIDFVADMADYARQTRGAPSFMVFPQNAAEIIRDANDAFDADADEYFSAISGIGQEDLFYDELTAQPAADVDFVLDQLREYHARDKTVLVTDYVIDQANATPGANNARVASFYSQCRAEGFVPYAAHRNRDLNEMVTLDPASGWAVAQPEPDCFAIVEGDLDRDGDVDGDDFRAFAACMTGPGGSVTLWCLDADTSPQDGDADLHDLAGLATALGEN